MLARQVLNIKKIQKEYFRFFTMKDNTCRCSRTLIACWTTRCVKGFLSLNPLALNHVPPDMTIQDVRGLDVWKSCLAFCLQNLWFISVKKLAIFGYVVGVFLPLKFKFISDNFKLVSQRKSNIFTTGKGVAAIIRESEGRRAEWVTFGRVYAVWRM